ncbi:MAG: hypothetical protein Q9192_009048, partial [Flavoplaca navasiana]
PKHPSSPSAPPYPILPNHIRPLLPNRINRRLQMGRNLQRHNTRIANPQSPNAINPQRIIHHPSFNTFVAAHSARTDRMPVRKRCVSDPVFPALFFCLAFRYTVW